MGKEVSREDWFDGEVGFDEKEGKQKEKGEGQGGVDVGVGPLNVGDRRRVKCDEELERRMETLTG